MLQYNSNEHWSSTPSVEQSSWNNYGTIELIAMNEG